MKNLIFIPEESDFIFDTNKNYKHSGDFGDIIYSLPAIRYFGGGSLYLVLNGLKSKKYDGSFSGLDMDRVNIIKPLLECQSYIKEVLIWNINNNIINIDFDLFRYVGNDQKNLCKKILYTFNVPFTEIEKPWLHCETKKIAKIVINRTFRYRNENMDYSYIRENFSDAVFVGSKLEYDDFVSSFGYLDYYPTKNLLEVAEVINGSELFIGNQSACMAIAIGLGKYNIQEYYPAYSDCIFDLENCNFFFTKRK